MNTYIALLRGINVSGKNIIRMQDLSQILTEKGLSNVCTYIQSGNVIFRSDQISAFELSREIEMWIMSEFHYKIDVIVQKHEELISVRNSNPFAAENPDPGNIYVVFLKSVPAEKNIRLLENKNFTGESWKLGKGVIYLYARCGYGKSKLNNNLIEKILDVRATARNWKTLLELIELSGK